VLNYLANAISPSNAHMFYKYDEKRDYGVEEPEIFAVYDRIILSKCLFLCCHRFTVNLTNCKVKAQMPILTGAFNEILAGYYN
jgi:hypothetical protein